MNDSLNTKQKRLHSRCSRVCTESKKSANTTTNDDITASDLHILSELPDDVALGRVFAHVKFRFPKAGGEDAVAQLHSTSHLCAPLPHHLREVRGLRVGRIILGSFIGPRFYGGSDAI